MNRFAVSTAIYLALAAPAFAVCTVPNTFATGDVVDAAKFNANFAALIACVAGAANPTATASDTAVNGSAATYMRSDGAPAVQKATSGQFGVVEVDGSTITASSGVISTAARSNVGGSVKLAANLATAGTSITVTADQITVGSTLTGLVNRLGSYSQVFNGLTTGAGGMDTGVIPASGWLCLYAIYNVSTVTASILGTNCATSSATIYAGANLPSGYTQSALLAPVPTDGGNNISRVNVLGRQAVTAAVVVLGGGAATAVTSVALSTAEPPNGTYVTGSYSMTPGAGRAGDNLSIYSTTNSIGQQSIASPVAAVASGGSFSQLLTPTAQTMFYSVTNATDAGSINISGYGW